MFFKKDLLAKVLDSSKTQTRRLSTRRYTPGRIYGVTCRRYQKSPSHGSKTEKEKQETT